MFKTHAVGGFGHNKELELPEIKPKKNTPLDVDDEEYYYEWEEY